MAQPVPFLTLFTIPKPFTGLANIHQRNALGSWKRLGDDVEVILCSDEQGVAEAAADFGARYIPDITRNEFGTPLVSSAFAAATDGSSAAMLCYVNSDIILMSDFVEVLRRLSARRFLLCGRRWNLDLSWPVDFSASWERDLRNRVEREGVLFAPEAMDYFAFPRGLINDMPPFAVGRTVWDNWLVFHARALGVAVIDATEAITIVHQNHNYQHIEGGISGAWSGPEALRNRKLGSQMLYPFTIADATQHLRLNGSNAPQGTAVRRAQARAALALRNRPYLRAAIRQILRAKTR